MKPLRLFQHQGSGVLITFCGLDGCGKTTQIQKLCHYLETLGIDVMLTKQPTKAVRESLIFRTYMDHPNHDGFDYRSLSLLAASDRVQHSNQVILPELEKGKLVISDRYFYSCIANLIARGYGEDEWIYEVSSFIPKPDLAFFLDIDVETAIQRVRNRPEERNRYIDVDLQYSLRKQYQELAKINNGILLPTDCDPEETFAMILQEVQQHVLMPVGQ